MQDNTSNNLEDITLTPNLLSPPNGGVQTPLRTGSISSKVRKILTASPKVTAKQQNGGKPLITSPNKTFGVPLEFIINRDNTDVPLIVTRLCDYLKQHGLNHEGLFRVNGNMKVVERFKTTFDKLGDADLEETGDVAAVASLLKMFLRELTDPVVPEDLQTLFIRVQDEHGKDKKQAALILKELVLRMPRINAYLLRYLCDFMLTIADESSNNKMSPLALAIVFGPNIFRCREGLEGLREQAYVNAVLLVMLQEFQEIFMTNNSLFAESRLKTSPEKPVSYTQHVKSKQNQQTKLASPDENETKKKTNVKKNSPKKKGNNKKINNIQTKSDEETLRSSSPSYPSVAASPLSKQYVAKTINSTVKEQLFGNNQLMSSTDSDLLDDTNSRKTPPEEPTQVENLDIYPSVKDRVNKLSPKKNVARAMSSPYKITKKPLTDTDLQYIAERTSSPLTTLTSSRAPPPQNRRRLSRAGTTHAKKGDQSDSFDTSQEMDSYSGEKDSDPQQLNVPPLELYKLSYEGDTQKTPRGRERQREDRIDRNGRDTPTQHKSPREPQASPTRHSRKQRDSWNEKRAEVAVMEFTPAALKKRIASLKKIINNFEENFEELEGRKPNATERQPIQKYITELSYAKKQLKDLVAEACDPPDLLINTQNGGGGGGYPQPAGGKEYDPSDFDFAKQQQQQPYPSAYNTITSSEDDHSATKEDTLVSLLRRLEEKRVDAGRPHELHLMAFDQLKEEKLAVQKALLQYENLHGRPETRQDKSLMRPLYDRYRKIKRRISTPHRSSSPGHKSITSNYSNTTRVSNTTSLHSRHHSSNVSNASDDAMRDGMLSPRGRDGTLSPRGREGSLTPTRGLRDGMMSPRYNDSNNKRHSWNDASSSHRPSSRMKKSPSHHLNYQSPPPDDLQESFFVTRRHFSDDPDPPNAPSRQENDDSHDSSYVDDAILHDASIEELFEQQKQTKRIKKRLGKILKDFEDNFFIDNQRRLQKDDRLPRESEYREYKLVKSKLRLIDALIAKRTS